MDVTNKIHCIASHLDRLIGKRSEVHDNKIDYDGPSLLFILERDKYRIVGLGPSQIDGWYASQPGPSINVSAHKTAEQIAKDIHKRLWSEYVDFYQPLALQKQSHIEFYTRMKCRVDNVVDMVKNLGRTGVRIEDNTVHCHTEDGQRRIFSVKVHSYDYDVQFPTQSNVDLEQMLKCIRETHS